MHIFYTILPFVTAICATNSTSSRLTLPSLPGPFPVNIHSNVELIDHDRLEISAPNGSTPQPRRLMVSIFQPLTHLRSCPKPILIDYAPPAIAAFYSQEFVANGTLERLQLQNCAIPPPPSRKSSPVLLFSPGFGVTRFAYSAEVQALASWGYTIISVDHTYEASAVQFPGGEIVHGTIGYSNSSQAHAQLVAIRVADLNSILNSMEADKISGLHCEGLDTKHVGVFGHSLGGATAVAALTNDSRYVAGINHDGSFDDSNPDEDISKPVLLMAAQMAGESHNQTTDPTWYHAWQHLRGWGLQLLITPSEHYTYTDLPLISKTLGIRIPQFLGENPIDGSRAFETVWKYSVAFFDHFLKDESESVLSGPSSAFPEVSFQNQTKYR